MKKEIPVYLFTGFLEAGKTRLIQETMEDERFNAGEPTLILLCEEGIEELDLSTFSGKNVKLVTVENEQDITTEFLSKAAELYHAERVLIEYNGMWMLQTLYEALPENWLVYQEFMLADATTFQAYNANMRQLTVDKLQSCEIIIFNRYKPSIDKMELHKIVRGVSRNATIGYEHEDGTLEQDTIEDPLPYDLEADVVEIKDVDYAIFYRDLSEDMEKYIGRTVKFTGIVARDKALPDNEFVVGRHVMVCCADDIRFIGFIAKANGLPIPASKSWQMVTAEVRAEERKQYKGVGPVLYVTGLEPAQEPEEEVVTFNS